MPNYYEVKSPTNEVIGCGSGERKTEVIVTLVTNYWISLGYTAIVCENRPEHYWVFKPGGRRFQDPLKARSPREALKKKVRNSWKGAGYKGKLISSQVAQATLATFSQLSLF